MRIVIKKILIMVAVIEIAACICFYICGPKGFWFLKEIYRKQITVQQNLNQLQANIVELEKQCQFLKTEFAQEKIVRERLLMKKSDEVVYVV